MRRALAAILLALAAGPAAAQAPSRADTVPLDTLRATVLRIPLPARAAPFAVSEPGGVALPRAGLALQAALSTVPGLQVDDRHNAALGERISIRGFGARSQFGVRGVRILVDGIPATLPDGQSTLNHVDPAALTRAEVLRGPGAALYGNASGGVLRLSTFGEMDGSRAVAAGGSDGLRRILAQASARSDAAWLTVRGARAEAEGFRDWSSSATTRLAAGAGWRGPAGELRATLHHVDYRARNPGSLTDSLLHADRTAAFAGNRAQRTGETGRQTQLGLGWTRGLGGGSAEVAAWGTVRSIDNPIPGRVVLLDRQVGGMRAAWSAAAQAGPATLRWSVGAEAERQDDDRRNAANVAGEPGAILLDQRERVSSASVFAQATASVGRVNVVGALRRDRFVFRVSDRFVGNDPDDSGRRAMGAWSPTLGASVALGPAVTAYANVATSFETPTTTELANRPTGAGGFNPDLRPQRATTWEAGAKAAPTAWARLEIAAYRAAVRDALVPFEVAGAPGRQFFRNAGRAVHRGVEAGAEIGPLAGVTARAAYTRVDARFAGTADGLDRDGVRVPGVAPHRFDATVDWDGPRGVFAGIDLRAVSATPVDDLDRAGALEAPGHAVLDLRAGWRGAGGRGIRWTPFVGVTNLLGRDYVAAVTVNAFGRRYYEPGPGRGVYAGVEAGVGR